MAHTALHALVDRALAIHDNNTLCEYCYMPLGSHSHEGLNCPNPSDFGPLFATTRFSALLCSFQADADSEMLMSFERAENFAYLLRQIMRTGNPDATNCYFVVPPQTAKGDSENDSREDSQR